jgi:hypothetical protein
MVAKAKATESEIVGLVQKKESNTIGSGPNQGNIYLSYQLADPQTGEETWYKQFNAVITGEPVQVGEVWRFHVSSKPANNGTIFHNVEKVLGKAGTATVTDVAGENVVVDVPPTNPTPPKPANPKPPAQPDMPGVYNRERSIERQVSVKSSVDLLTIRANLLQLVWQTMPGELPEEGAADPRFAIADDMYDWVVKAGKPTELAAAFAAYMQS